MKTEPLVALREQVSGDEALRSYLVARFGRPGSHIIGLKKAKKAGDFPYFCYVMGLEKRDSAFRERRQEVSILWGINEKEIDHDTNTCLGVLEMAEIGELLVSAILKDCSLGHENAIRVEPSIETATDLGLRHPIYEAEMALSIRIREQ